MCFQKNSLKEVISVASLLPLMPKDFSWMVSENWALVCEKLGKGQELFSVPTSGNPSNVHVCSFCGHIELFH